MGQSGVAEVDVVVDDAGQQVAACSVNDFVDRHGGVVVALEDFFDAVIVDDERPDETAPFVDERHVLDLRTKVHSLAFLYVFG